MWNPRLTVSQIVVPAAQTGDASEDFLARQVRGHLQTGVIVSPFVVKRGRIAVAYFERLDAYKVKLVAELSALGLSRDALRSAWRTSDNMHPDDTPKGKTFTPGLAYVIEQLREDEKWFFHLTFGPDTVGGVCRRTAEPAFVRSLTRAAIVLPLHTLLVPMIPHVDALPQDEAEDDGEAE
jgi:hypothetical protein